MQPERTAATRVGVETEWFIAHADSPEAIVAHLRDVVARDPDQANDYVTAALGVLESEHAFTAASAVAPLASDPLIRTALLLSLAGAWARVEPAAAAAWGAMIPESPDRAAVISQIVTTWSALSPSDAARYASGLSPGETRRNATLIAVQRWSEADPAGAQTWLSHLSASPDFDGAKYAVALCPTSLAQPLTATAWAERIADPYLRLEAVKTLLTTWAASDPSAARAYLLNTPTFGPETRHALLGQFFPRD